MSQRAVIRTVLAGVTSLAGVLCVLAQAPIVFGVAMLMCGAAVFVLPFGRAPSAQHLDQVMAHLTNARSAVEVAPLTQAVVWSNLMALPCASEKRFLFYSGVTLLFRDELAPATWRSLATQLRMQRGRSRA